MRPTVDIIHKVNHKLPGKIDPGIVKVGFPQGKVSGDIIQRATWTHFGTRGGASGGGWGGPVPARPFLQIAMGENAGKYRAVMKGHAARILLGAMKSSTSLKTLGMDAQGDVQSTITSLQSPPNAPLTVQLKGSSNPLIDSGAMRGAVTYKVEMG